MKKQFRDFESAREFARVLNLKGTKEWHAYCKSGNKPNNIPTNPYKIYKKEWKGMGDWTGTGNVSPSHDKVYRSFKEARDFARSLGLATGGEWHAYCKSGNKPDDIPYGVPIIYKKDYNGWGDFLGTGRTRDFCSFKDARKFVKALKLKTLKEWQEYCKSGNKPNNIPSSPIHSYKKDFKGWGDFLGTGTLRTQDRVYRPFKEARAFVRSLKLKNWKEWIKYCKSGNKPDDIPADPSAVYREWKKK